MPVRDYDAYLWLGLGVFLFAAVKGISWQLHEIVRLNENHPKSEQADSQAQATEDAIPLSVLETLAFCPNYDIREAANKIICSRYIKSQFAQHRERKLVFDGDDSENVEALLDTLIRYGSNLEVELDRDGPDEYEASTAADDNDDGDGEEGEELQRQRRRRRRPEVEWGVSGEERRQMMQQRRRRREAVVVGSGEEGFEEVIVHEPVVLEGEVDAGGVAAILDQVDLGIVGGAGDEEGGREVYVIRDD